MFIHLSLTILYSDVEHLSKYSPVTLHLSPATGIFIENRECYFKKTSQQQFPLSILLSTISLSFLLLMPTSVLFGLCIYHCNSTTAIVHCQEKA